MLQHNYINKHIGIYSAILLVLLLLLVAQPAAAEATFWDLDLKGEGIEFNVVDCEHGAGEKELKRTVVQVIDGTFHRWNEYLVGEEGQFCIVLKEPEERPLLAEEARKLLAASKRWMDPVVTPTKPEYVDPSEIFDMDSLMPVLEGSRPDWVGDIFVYQNYALTSRPERVTQSDTEQYPWHTIGFVHVTFGLNNFRASGSLIGPQTVLTNAHNLYNSGMGGYFTELKFYPGQYQESEGSMVIRPYGHREAVDGIVSQEYITYEGSLNLTNAHDYGAFFLETPFEEISTFMPLEFDYEPTYINTAGYPYLVDGETSFSMWYDRGPVVDLKEREFTFEAKSGQGASGSPVWVYDEDIENSRFVGLLAQALVDTDYRRGPRLTHHNQALIEEWMQWSPEEEETSSEPEEEPEEVEVEYSLTLTVDPAEGGAVSGEGTYLENETVVIIANAADGYDFIGWTVNGTVISESEQYQFQIEGNLELTANFEAGVEEIGSEPEPEPQEKSLVGIVVEVGGDLVRVDLADFAAAYYNQDCDLYIYLCDGNQYPGITAVQSDDGYILLEEYAKNYYLYRCVITAIENSVSVELEIIEAPF